MSCKREKRIIINAQNQSFFEEYEKLAEGNKIWLSKISKALNLKTLLLENHDVAWTP